MATTRAVDGVRARKRRTVTGAAVAATLAASLLSGCLHTERVSVASDGTEANGPSAPTSISADGRYITFTSTATNLVADDTNGSVSDLYLRDNVTKTVTKAAIEADGTALDTHSSWGEISDDGRYVTFSTVEPATADDPDENSDLFRHDRETGETILVSKPPPGITGDSWGGQPSANGQHVVVRGATTAFVYDITEDVATFVATAEIGPAEVSNDGQTVVFTSWTPLTAGETTYRSWDVHVFDVATGGLERITPTAWGIGDPIHWLRSLALTLDISPDARFIAYTGMVSNGRGLPEAYLHDRTTGITETMPGMALPAAHWSQFEGVPTVSDDGRYVAYNRTLYSELERPPGTLVVHDREQDSVTVIKPPSTIGPTRVLISGDGRWTTFAAPTVETAGDTNGVDDVFVRYAHDPQVSVETPHEIGPGTHDLVFDAKELVETPAVSVNGGGVTVNSVTISGTELHVTVTVSPGAAAGARDVYVYNNGSWPGRLVVGATNLCDDCVTITP